MPTKREREYYAMGFRDGIEDARRDIGRDFDRPVGTGYLIRSFDDREKRKAGILKRKSKLSEWNKYVKNKRNHITYRDGKLNLKKMAVAFRRKKRR